MYREESVEGLFQHRCQQSFLSCVWGSVSISCSQCALSNPSQSNAARLATNPVEFRKGRGNETGENGSSAMLVSTKTLQTERTLQGRGERHKEGGGFEMSVRGANGKVNYIYIYIIIL